MARFFVDPENIGIDEVRITGDDVKHISRVLRMRENEAITVCDKCGSDYDCTITQISSDAVRARINSKYPNSQEPPIYITIYQGLPKSDKMDYIVQKCIELGACRIIPVDTKRVVSKPKDIDKKIFRWQKIAEEAAKQCGRGIIPQVAPLMKFTEALNEMAGSEAIGLMPYECEHESRLRDALKQNNGITKINILIGPEGGFDETEADAALKAGIKTVTLGPRILRTETAPIAACAAVMYELGDW
ncbi:MAG: 16S rRNA (uracil(1498)-N(3))-methyltransferase [Clostridia bacterium]|nr:16S rRNA (uracil(1498)-N(3))-methyltransferase [Clostridia bacterium]